MDQIANAVLEWLLSFGPRSVRIGCTVLVLILAVALLTIGLWWKWIA